MHRIPGIHFAPVMAPGGDGGAATDAGPAEVPFLIGSNWYREPPFAVDTLALDTNPHEFIRNITPGNFLRGVTMQVTSTGGVLGTSATLAGDSPWSMFSNISIEDISGGPIAYGMSGFAYFVIQKYLHYWVGDPSKRSDFSNTINPAFTLTIPIEVRDTLAAVANTDARAQYRIRYTVAPLVQSGQFGLVSTATGVTAPTVTIKLYVNSWSQPDLQDLLGNPISQQPEGLVASRFLMHELPAFNGGSNVIRFTLVGNEIRGIIIIVRNGDANKTRVNLTDTNTGPIDYRLDARREWKMNPSQLVEEMQKFYAFLGNGATTREAGVYVIPRHRQPGDLTGEFWLQTVEQTLLQWELNGGDIANPPGSLEVIYDQLAIAGQPPAELEGV